MEKKVKKNSYPCENCSKIFLSSSARSKHIRITHLGEKNYQCEVFFKLSFCCPCSIFFVILFSLFTFIDLPKILWSKTTITISPQN